jgi:hypothetical protein
MGRLSSENLKEQEGMAYSTSMLGLSFRVVNLPRNAVVGPFDKGLWISNGPTTRNAASHGVISH